jgi:chaperonin GroES
MSFKVDDIRVQRDLVLLKRIDSHQEGLIVTPANAREVGNSAEVIKVGPGLVEDGEVIPMELKAGDEVMIGPYAGTELECDGNVYLLMREPDVLGIVIR